MGELDSGWGAGYVRSNLDERPFVESVVPGRRWGEWGVGGFRRADELADGGGEGRHCYDERGGFGWVRQKGW